jgi:GNAT superfamily N-acetyltransferase
LMFPAGTDEAAVRRGLVFADARRLTVGAWLARDSEAAALESSGFERGWQPWWMVRELAEVAGAAHVCDPRVRLESDTRYEAGSDAAAQLELARAAPDRTWHAAARTDGRLAGHAWAHLDDGIAGIYDMAVWRDRRTGLGTALLNAVCAAAARAGARHAVLNATPEGELLYRTQGFARVGEGITWWRHSG